MDPTQGEHEWIEPYLVGKDSLERLVIWAEYIWGFEVNDIAKAMGKHASQVSVLKRGAGLKGFGRRGKRRNGHK